MPHAKNPKLKTRNPKQLVPLLLSWFAKNARDLPWRRTRDPYAIWVSEIMLQQTQVKTVMPYWERWMQELPTIESLAKASPDKIYKLWEGLGYYTRVRNMQKAAQEIILKSRSRRGGHQRLQRGDIKASNSLRWIESPDSRASEIAAKFPPLPGGEGRGEGERKRPPVHWQAQNSSTQAAFPKLYADVLALPGIGRYTAGAICSIAFNQPTPIMDGNVIRVLTRVFGISENPREKDANARLWNLAKQLVALAAPKRSEGGCSHLNQSLMELGALICTPREPKCPACPIAKHCFAFQNNRVADFPNLDKRPAATARRFAAFVVENRGKYLVQQRPAGVVNAHLWEFPNIELNGAPSDAVAAARELFGFAPKELRRLSTIKHTITRYRITVEVFRLIQPATPKVGQSCRSAPSSRHARSARDESLWLSLSELRKLSFPSAHKKILESLPAELIEPS